MKLMRPTLRNLFLTLLFATPVAAHAIDPKKETQKEGEDEPLDMSPPYRLPQWPGATRTLGPQTSIGAAIGSRGTLSESDSFDETMNAEIFLGLPFLNGIDLTMAAGRFLMRGSTIRLEGGARTFLFWDQGGPYLSFAWGANRSDDEFNFDERPVLTLGLFGGNGLYAELDLRTSAHRPVAAIFEWGIRLRAPILQERVTEPGPGSSSALTARSADNPSGKDGDATQSR